MVAGSGIIQRLDWAGFPRWFLHLQVWLLSLSVSTQCLIFQGLSSFRASHLLGLVLVHGLGLGTPVLEDDMAQSHIWLTF